jgi:hypothetical protein
MQWRIERALNLINLKGVAMEIVSFLDPQGGKLYCIGPFRDRAQASRAAAGLDRISAAAGLYMICSQASQGMS